jgi:hypothetical protein
MREIKFRWWDDIKENHDNYTRLDALDSKEQ